MTCRQSAGSLIFTDEAMKGACITNNLKDEWTAWIRDNLLKDECSIETIILNDELHTEIVIEINDIELGDGRMK